MLYAYFKRILLEQTGYMLLLEIFLLLLCLLTEILCTTNHYKISKHKNNVRTIEKKSPYLPSTTFATNNYRLVYGVYLALNISVGLFSHCKDVRF